MCTAHRLKSTATKYANGMKTKYARPYSMGSSYSLCMGRIQAWALLNTAAVKPVRKLLSVARRAASSRFSSSGHECGWSFHMMALSLRRT